MEKGKYSLRTAAKHCPWDEGELGSEKMAEAHTLSV